MLQLRETQQEIQKQRRMQKRLAKKSQQILRAQADLLCKALQQLKQRSDAGQHTASLIWDSLIEGIIQEIPQRFFDDYSQNFFWTNDEEINENELVFRNLLEQAAAAKNTEIMISASGDNNNVVTLTKNNSLIESEIEELRKSLASIIPYRPRNARVDACRVHEKIEEDSEDDLLEHLIDMLKVARERTELGIWDWKEEDEDLKQEIGNFNASLKMAMGVFKKLRDMPDIADLVESLESISPAEAEKLLRDMKKDRLEAGSDLSSNESNDEDEYDDDIDQLWQDNHDGKARTKSRIKIVKSTSAAKLLDDNDDEGYIIRHAASKKEIQKMFPNVQCDHAGYTFPTSHCRDWKRDGFRCICGQKFRFMSILEKHIASNQEARMLYCDQCDYKVTRKCCMDRHMKDNHDKPKMLRACRRLYQCKYGCEQVMKSKRELFDHERDTDRQCKRQNAGKLPVKPLPGTPIAFVDSLKRTNIRLSFDRVDKVLSAAERDAERILKIGDDKGKKSVQTDM